MAASVEYTYTATDGDVSTAVLTFALIIHPDPVEISGPDGSIFEGASSSGGDLEITNAGSRSTQFVPISSRSGTYGAFTLRAGGGWSYALRDPAPPEINALNVGDTLTDTFIVTAVATPPTVTRDFVITINGQNDTPTGGITTPAGDITVAHGTVVNLAGTGTDVDNDDSSLDYTWSVSPNVGSFGDTKAAMTTWTAPTTDATVVLTFVIDDLSGAASRSTLTIDVVATVVTFSGTFSGGVTEDAGVNFVTGDIDAENDDTGNPADIVEQTDADSISMYGTFTVTDTATGGTWTYTLDNTNSVVNALPDAGSLMDTFTVAAVDGGTQDITIAITGANDPPVAAIDSPTDGTQVDFGATVTLTGSATDPDSLSDLTYRWSTVPANRGSFTTNTGRTGVWVAPTSGTAPVTMRLLVIDTFFPGVTNSAQITLNPTETAVTFAGDTTGGVNEGDTTQITGDLDATTTSDDAATDVVAQSGTSGLYGTFTIDTDGMWTYTLDNTNAAINALAEDATLDDPFTVTAEANAAATQVITITITGVNDAPTASITTPAPSLSGTLTFVAGQRVNLVGTQTDVDVGNTFTYAWTANPATGSFANSTVATTTYHPPAVTTAEDHTLTLTVTDNDGGSDTATFVLAVTQGPGVGGDGTDDSDSETDDSPQVGTDPDIDDNGVITSGGTASGMLTVARIPTDQTGNPLSVTHSILTQPTYGIASIDNAALTRNVGGFWNYRLDNNPMSRPFGPQSGGAAPAEDTFMVRTTIGPEIILDSEITVTLTAAVFPDDRPDIALRVGERDVSVAEGGVLTINVDEEEMVTLNATPTRDPESPQTEGGTPQPELSFMWTHTAIDGVEPTDDDRIMLASVPPNGPIVSFDAPDERTTLEFELEVTVTGSDVSAMATIIVQVGRTSERALQKTLAAFGRAFAAGTVSVFEDYLTTPATSANTSHFTIGGHKFDMATTTPSAPVGTGRDLSALATPPSFPNTPTPSFPNDRKTGSTTPLSFPNDRKTGSDSDHVFHRIGNPVEHDLANTINSANLADTTSNGATTNADTPATTTTTLMSGQDLLMKSAFHLNFNNAAPGTPSWSLWARATTGNFDGKPEDDFDLNGDVTSAYLGADYRTPTGVRLAVAISETSGEVDYADTSADNAGEGDLEADLTSILPYIQWQPTDTTNAWVVLGYGEGDAELTDDRGPTEVDIEMQMLAAGVSGDLTTYNRTEWSWKASAFTVELESDKNVAADLPAVDADAQRLRAAIQGRIPGQPSANGTQLVPHWELGLRWDDGDAETGTGADLGLGFDYRHPSTGWSIQAQAKTLLTHEESDYKEWTAGIQARLDPGAPGKRHNLHPNPRLDQRHPHPTNGNRLLQRIRQMDHPRPATRVDRPTHRTK